MLAAHARVVSYVPGPAHAYARNVLWRFLLAPAGPQFCDQILASHAAWAPLPVAARARETKRFDKPPTVFRRLCRPFSVAVCVLHFLQCLPEFYELIHAASLRAYTPLPEPLPWWPTPIFPG